MRPTDASVHVARFRIRSDNPRLWTVRRSGRELAGACRGRHWLRARVASDTGGEDASTGSAVTPPDAFDAAAEVAPRSDTRPDRVGSVHHLFSPLGVCFMLHSSHRTNRKGFTLIELLIVV